MNYDITKNYYVTASAGTGKTYNIIRMVEELIKNNVPLKRILIVTYTEKAVEELKHRVRRDINGIDANDSEIYTIHSFCQKSISEYAVSCSMPTSLAVIDESEVEDYVDRYIRDEEIYDKIISIKSGNNKINAKIIKELLVSLVKKYYLTKDGNVDEDIISIIDTSQISEERRIYFNKLLYVKDYEELRTVDKSLYDEIEVLNEEESPSIAKALYEIVTSSFGSGEDSLFSSGDIKLGDFSKAKRDDRYKEVLRNLNGLNKEFKGYCAQLVNYIALDYINDLYMKWQKEKQLRQVQTFNDMIRTVREEITSCGPLKEKIQAQYDYAIIDEFQDTNGLQWNIFKNLFLDQKHHLVVVGDEKQSIYSFQGADVEVYKKATGIMHEEGAHNEVLDENYRSSEAMINATNAIFSKEGFFDDFKESKYPVYKEHKKEKLAKLDGKSFKPIVIAYDDEKEKGIKEYDYAKIVAHKILEYVSKDENGKSHLQIMDEDKGDYRDVTFRDITILSKTRNEITAIKRELKRVGIPFSGYKDDSLFTGIECAHWIALLGAIDAPDFTGKNRKLFKRALFTKFFGCSIRDLSNDKYDRDDLDEMDLIKRWKLVLKTARYEDFIDSIIVDSNIDERMSELNDIQSLSIYKQIGSYAIEFLSNNHTVRELIRDLEKKLKRETTSDKNDSLVEISTDFDCVHLMTIHASKGLEFPVVIFAGNLKNYKNLDKIVISHIDKKPVITIGDNEEHKNEATLELKRLFYVAFTRARYLLMIPDYKANDSKNGYDFLNGVIKSFREDNIDYYEGVDYQKFKRTYDVEKLKDKVKEIINNENKDNDSYTKEEQDKVIKNLISDKKNKLIYKHSYSSLSHGTSEEMLEDEEREREGSEVIQDLSLFDNRGVQVLGCFSEEEATVTPINYPQGSQIGNAIHEVFELLDYSNSSDEIIEKLIKDAFTKEGIKLEPTWIYYTMILVHNVLNAKIPVVKGKAQSDEWFSLKSITSDNKKTEIEFNFNLFSDERLHNYANGFMDLLIRRGDYYAVLDWKSDRLNDEDLFSYSSYQDLSNHTNNRYSIQRVLYSYCLIKWLKNYYHDKTYDEIFENHFGGIYYVYVRGCIKNTSNGIFAKTWSSFKELEESFNEIMKSKIWR